jgi:hypothetical protein
MPPTKKELFVRVRSTVIPSTSSSQRKFPESAPVISSANFGPLSITRSASLAASHTLACIWTHGMFMLQRAYYEACSCSSSRFLFVVNPAFHVVVSQHLYDLGSTEVVSAILYMTPHITLSTKIIWWYYYNRFDCRQSSVYGMLLQYYNNVQMQWHINN